MTGIVRMVRIDIVGIDYDINRYKDRYIDRYRDITQRSL
jgi:hypothetical protein